ncbi:BRO-N domain-containing protein [Proteus mirabilis]|uniref:hypothetical protein n=1 Tax=Proteus mirabilis TaxID=584 RepID=UPI0021B0BD25|nr:hypothetical protein [Proteus mirabilis]
MLFNNLEQAEAFTAQLKTLTEPYRKSNLRKTVNGVFCGAVISGEQVRFSIRIYTMSKSLVFKGNEITPFDNGDNKIWFTSSQMAKLLEYKNEKSVTNLYNANKDEFSDDMTMVTETMTNGINNNLRKKKVRIFSVRGAHLIGMLAKEKPALCGLFAFLMPIISFLIFITFIHCLILRHCCKMIFK